MSKEKLEMITKEIEKTDLPLKIKETWIEGAILVLLTRRNINPYTLLDTFIEATMDSKRHPIKDIETLRGIQTKCFNEIPNNVIQFKRHQTGV